MKTYCWSKNKKMLLGNDGEIMIFVKFRVTGFLDFTLVLLDFLGMGERFLKVFYKVL